MRTIDITSWGRKEYINFYTKVWHVPVIPILENKKPATKWAEYQERQPTDDELKVKYGVDTWDAMSDFEKQMAKESTTPKAPVKAKPVTSGPRKPRTGPSVKKPHRG